MKRCAEANQGVVSKAGLSPICPKLQTGLGLFWGCSPHVCRGRLSCKCPMALLV